MDKPTRTEAIATDPFQAKLRPYHSPTLTAYGSVARLTQGGTGSFTDAMGDMMMMMMMGMMDALDD